MGERVAYPCRGQPFHPGHIGAIIQFFNDNPSDQVIVAVIKNRTRDTRNPFLSKEALKITRMTLAIYGMKREVEAKLVKRPGINANKWFDRLKETCKVDGILTGNERMAGLAEDFSGLKVFSFTDGEASKIHSSEIRKLMSSDIDEDQSEWRAMLTPPVADYILGLNIDWAKLPEARIRDWWHD